MAEPDYDSPLGGGGGAGGGLTPSPCPPGQVFMSPVGGCRPQCPQGQTWDEGQHTCRSRSGSVSGDPSAPCPPGESREASSAICRCPPGTCRDVVSKECRNFNPRREKVNETDDIERESGGGRGYCRQLDPGMQGGGGGVAGGAGGGAAGGAAGGVRGGPAQSTDMLNMFGAQSSQIWDNLAPIMSGQQTRFSPEVMAQIDSKAKLATRGGAKVAKDALLRDAITRGFGRSPGAVDLGSVERAASADYTKITTDARIKKAETDFLDRMMALEAAEKWLAQMQNYAATLDQTAAGREKAVAEIALGYARISAERDMLQQRLQADLAIAQGGWANSLQLANLANLSNLFR